MNIDRLINILTRATVLTSPTLIHYSLHQYAALTTEIAHDERDEFGGIEYYGCENHLGITHSPDSFSIIDSKRNRKVITSIYNRNVSSQIASFDGHATSSAIRLVDNLKEFVAESISELMILIGEGEIDCWAFQGHIRL